MTIQTHSINDFSAGLNTQHSILVTQDGSAAVCTNFDLSINPGTLTRRKGFEAFAPDSVGTGLQVKELGQLAFGSELWRQRRRPGIATSP